MPSAAPRTLAIMQPYLFPYLGYFQLIAAADRFVVYDDVTYIKNGWINRNRILDPRKDRTIATFTVPLRGAGSHVAIRDVAINEATDWRRRLLLTISQTYKRAPQFERVFSLVSGVITRPETHIRALAVESLRAVCAYLDLSREWVESSSVYGNRELAGPTRVLDICRREGATRYVNAIGGRKLYHQPDFADAGLELRFVEPALFTYPQLENAFVPGLSIIDVLMFNERDRVRRSLGEARLT